MCTCSISRQSLVGFDVGGVDGAVETATLRLYGRVSGGGADEWPDTPEVVERVAVRSCVRRGAAIDLVLDRGRENRSQLVVTTARGRQMIFWQTSRTAKKPSRGTWPPAEP